MKTNKLQRHDISLRLGILFLCTTILWLVLGINTYAEGTGRITTTIRIRAGAGTNTDVIGSAEMGTTVTITGKATDGNGAVWYQIVNDATSLGYVKGEYVEAVTGTIPDVSGATSGSSSTGSEPATPEPVVIPMDPVSAMTNQDNARVRQNPSDASEVVETIGMDVSLTVDGQITGDDGYIWYRVSFTKDGVSKTGYIRTDYLTISSTPEAPTTEDPATQQPTVVSEDYVLEYQTDEEGAQQLYLLDYPSGRQIKITDLLTAFDQNKKNYEALEKTSSTVGSQKIAIIFLIVVCCLLLCALVFLFFQIRDLKDDTILRPSQRSPIHNRPEKKPLSENRKVMQTVTGANPKPPVRPNPLAPGGAGSKVSDPRTTQSGSRPANAGMSQGQPRVQGSPRAQGQPRVPGQGQPRPQSAGQSVQGRPKPQGTSRPQGQGQGQPQATSVQHTPGWKSKNFMADDDEFEFDFLPVDSVEKR